MDDRCVKVDQVSTVQELTSFTDTSSSSGRQVLCYL